MLIFERGADRYVIDSESGRVTLFDPGIHDLAGLVGPPKGQSAQAPSEEKVGPTS